MKDITPAELKRYIIYQIKQIKKAKEKFESSKKENNIYGAKNDLKFLDKDMKLEEEILRVLVALK